MKKVYWRPQGVSRSALILVAIVSVLGLAVVELYTVKRRQPYFEDKLQAAHFALEAMHVVKTERFHMNLPIDLPLESTPHPEIGVGINLETDPAQSGLIGTLMSPVTSGSGSLPAKQTSANPNFAAVLVQMLKRAHVREGDVVAVGCSGSFPAMNICVYAAVKALKLKPIVISSAASSEWGANDPNFLWIDMERMLNENNIFPYRSVAVSLGGIGDTAIGLSEEGVQMLEASIKRNGIPLLKEKDFAASLDKRMAIYREQAAGAPIKAYINVGGGTISVGTRLGKKEFQPGLNLHKPVGGKFIDSVMLRFMNDDVPVIHLTRIEQLATYYGLPIQPKTTPSPGDGAIFYREEYSLALAGAVLFGIMLTLYAFVRSELGHRILKSSARRKEDFYQEPMV